MALGVCGDTAGNITSFNALSMQSGNEGLLGEVSSANVREEFLLGPPILPLLVTIFIRLRPECVASFEGRRVVLTKCGRLAR